MPEGRMLKKKISFDEKLGQLSLESLLIFTWTIPHLDVKGRILGDPFYIKATVFPLIDKISVGKIKKGLKELSKLDLILIYGSKVKYIQFNGFLKNQKISENREAKSTIPDPDLLTSSSGVTQDTSLKLSLSLNKSLKLKEEDQDQTLEQQNNDQPSNFELPLPLLTQNQSSEPQDYENIFQITDSIKTLLATYCKLDNPDKGTLSAYVKLVTETKQVSSRTAFRYLRDTFIEFESLPDDKRNMKYLYSQVKGRINDGLIRWREGKAKAEKDIEMKESSTVNNPDIERVANKFQIG